MRNIHMPKQTLLIFYLKMKFKLQAPGQKRDKD